MSFSRQLARLGLLGTFSLVGLSACALCPAYRAPQGISGSSPQTVVTSSPPVTDAAPTTPAAAPSPPEESSAASTLSVPGPVGPAPAPGSDAGSSKPSDVIPPPPAPPAVPTSSNGANSAASNHDQLQTQKPLEVTPSASGQADGVSAAGQPGAPSPLAANVMVTIPQTASKPPAEHPVGPLTKLRARFHNLIQPPPKSTAKSSKATKSTNPAGAPQQPPQVVAGVRIPLPMSDPNRVVLEDSRAAHTIVPASENQVPVAPVGVREAQTSPPPANLATGSAASTQGVEPWPFSPQAAVKTAQVTNAAPADDFDPIPVDEYKAAVARASDATSLPTFNQASASESRQAANGASNGPLPQPAPAQASSEMQVVPTAPSQANPAAQVDAQNSSVPQRPVSSTNPLPQAVPTVASGPAGSAAPAIQIPSVPTTEQTVPTPAPAMRPAQWIGGRYGQPAWMVPYLAGPEAPVQSSGQ